MTIICGTIITICVLIPAIIPSMAAGSESGLGGDCVSPCLGGPSFKYVPSANAFDRFCEMDWYKESGMGEFADVARRTLDRARARLRVVQPTLAPRRAGKMRIRTALG